MEVREIEALSNLTNNQSAEQVISQSQGRFSSAIPPYKHPADCMSIKVRPHGQTCPKIFELHINICLIHSRLQKQDMAACHRNRAVQPHQQLSAWDWGRAKASRL